MPPLKNWIYKDNWKLWQWLFACLLILLSLSCHSKHYLINQTSALIEHFASGANERRIRQTLSHRRQHGKEPVADYSFSIRSLCSRLNLPRSEWIHYFLQGLKPEIREYMILQQPVSFEAAENFAKLKETVLSSVKLTPSRWHLKLLKNRSVLGHLETK